MCEEEWNLGFKSVINLKTYKQDQRDKGSLSFIRNSKQGDPVRIVRVLQSSKEAEELDLTQGLEQEPAHHNLSLYPVKECLSNILEFFPEDVCNFPRIVIHRGFMYQKKAALKICVTNIETNKTVIAKIGDWADFAVVGDNVIYFAKLYIDFLMIKRKRRYNLFCTKFSSEGGFTPISPVTCTHEFSDVSSMTGHGNHLYIIEKDLIIVYDTKSGQHHIWDIPQLKDILKHDNPLQLMSLQSTLLLQVNTDKKVKLYLIKPYWPSKCLIYH